MALHGRVVPFAGPITTGLMLIGERPGESEAASGKPFVGRAGKEQERYMVSAGMHPNQFRRGNTVLDYAEGNPDPTDAEIRRWVPDLIKEIQRCNPRYILAVGRFSARWFLGDVDVAALHGIPCYPAPSCPAAHLIPGTIIIPVGHPAWGFWDDDARAQIHWDYHRAVGLIQGRIRESPRHDVYAGVERYVDVTGRQLAAVLRQSSPDSPIAIDTEGLLNSRWFWSIQVSLEPGTGYVLRASQADFGTGIAAIAAHCLSPAEPVTFVHSAMHDFYVCRAMGLDLYDCNLYDTRYAAYIQRVEPQGLKGLSRRHFGMDMDDYSDVVGGVALDQQLEYLMRVYDDDWPAPEPRIEYSNDGTCKLYTPQPVHKRAFAILDDYYSGKRDKDGNPVDPAKRWKKVDFTLRHAVESRYGPFPTATLADVPLDRALRYAGRDPDATLRLGLMWQGSGDQRFLKLWQDGNGIIPVFEEMQSSGMLANKQYMIDKSEEMWSHMCKQQAYISHNYWQDRPFNPASSDQVATLMRRRGLHGEKYSKKTGKMSTAKKSIEHLRFTDDAMARVIDWREHAKMRDAFYDPIVERIGPDRDFARIHTDLNCYKVDSRRISSSDPNLTAIPVRNDLGVQVRDGFEAEDGCEIGSWDQSQIEMRYMAHLSRDPKLVEFFNDPKKDVHGETAAAIFGLVINERASTKEERYANVDEMQHRYPAKRAGFGIITNISGLGLFDQLRMFGCQGWDQESCDRLIAEWLKFYKGVGAFLVNCKNEVRAKGLVYDEFGMPKFLPGVWSEDRVVAAAAERAASSHKISAGAQGMMQRSLIWLKPYVRGLQLAGEKIRFILQIHDEVLMEFDKNLWSTIDPLVQEALIYHGKQLIVPVKCSSSHARTWGQV